MSQNVRVTNRNEFDIHGRFAGIDFAFPVGQAVVIPEEAATHIFGYRTDRARAITRNGWSGLTPDGRLRGEAIIDAVQMAPVAATSPAPGAEADLGPVEEIESQTGSTVLPMPKGRPGQARKGSSAALS